ncbi:tryptophan synthase subunit alpha [Nakamurella endophytica]|uniref:Tryptophan synthase alpha chain n=1 Tax=Nakamurella endophytica TaxID=1748367 RepID=A0A917SQ20_9ACTN|nr:tryptophan synthase subunit alpha [Nakamurella endophytica]GGL90845.1 tryptophan synthase alpha chain [Nakamurella endophytica]
MTATDTGATARGTGDRLAELFTATRGAGRAALVGYLPAGYPTAERSARAYAALLDSGCDLVEVGVPYSDPVIDGPVIQAASDTARGNGFRLSDLFGLVEGIAARGGRAVVMTYINPVLSYGMDRFARDLAAAGGLGVITPDLIVDEADEWLAAADRHGIDPIFLVAPASSAERIARTAQHTRGFLYAASTMGVTGARDQVSSAAPELVTRCRALTDLPIGVGLGVRTGAQAAEIARFADAVIVGSAFTSMAGAGDAAEADAALAGLAAELADGVRIAAAAAAPSAGSAVGDRS